MNRTIFYVAAMGIAVSACHGEKEKRLTTTADAPDISVAQPVVKDVVLTRFYPGYLSAIQFVDIVARVNGTLLSTAYKAGDRVKKGQVLFQIEPTIYRNTAEQAAASLQTAEAQLEYARSNYARLNEALASDAVSHIEVLQAEANVKEAEASVSDAKAQLSTARTNLGYCTIRAPFDGVMSICEYNTDAYLNGEASPVKLATIYDDSRMYTYFNVASGQHLPQLPDSISIDQTDGQRSYAARLNYVSPDIDLGTGTLLLRADMDNDDHQLKSGQYVGVTLPYEDVHDAVLIGSASVGTDQAGSYIYVVDHDNTVRMRRIETGQTVDDTLRVVTAGLKPGERYVTKALLKVRDGMHINPINSTDKR